MSDLYVDALSQLGIQLELDQTSTTGFRGRISATGDFGSKLLGRLGFGAESGSSKEKSKKEAVVGHDINDLRFVADILKASNRTLVVEDFHYMSMEDRRHFAFELKSLWDYGVYVLVVGVWSQSNMLLYLNPDLSGRVHEVSIYWHSQDLDAVLEKGARALQLYIRREVKEHIIGLCYSNVGILQKLTLETLDYAGAGRDPADLSEVTEPAHVDAAAMFYAEQLNPLYQQFARRVSQGIRRRKGSTGIYAHAMAIILSAEHQELIDGLNVNKIFDIAHNREPRIQKGNLKSVLEKIESLQVDEDGRGLILSYNEATGDITAVDRQLLLYRKYSTVDWPWRDMLAEVGSANGFSGESES